MNVLRKQPALVISLIEALLGFLVTLQFAFLTAEQSAAILALVVAVGGFAVGHLSKDEWMGRLTGLTKAVILLGVVYGANVSQESQAALVTLVTSAGAIWLWDRNTPKVK